MILSDEPRFSRLAAQPPSRELPATDQPLGLDEELMAYYDARCSVRHQAAEGAFGSADDDGSGESKAPR